MLKTVAYASAISMITMVAVPPMVAMGDELRVVPCEFPDGWTAADETRSIQGTPEGLNHRCVVDQHGIVRDDRGRPTN